MKWVLAGEVGEELPEDFKGEIIDGECKPNTLVGDISCGTFLGLIQRAWRTQHSLLSIKDARPWAE
jgi:hypothetical protein